MPEVKGNTLKDKQEELIKILGFDYETFRNTACFEQGGSDSFSKLTPKEAKLAVMKILQLSKLEQKEKECREVYKKLFEKGTILKSQVEFMETNIDWKVEDTAPILKEIEDASTKLELLRTTIESINKQREIVFQINQLENTIGQFEALDVCPTCKQTVSEQHKTELLKGQRESLSVMKKTVDLDNINKLTLYNKQYNELIALIAEKRNTVKTIEDKKEKIKQLAETKEKAIQELEEIRVQLAVYKNLIEAFGKNGIPAHIIANTVPEIEAIANSLLDSLEVGFQISIATQKTLKDGNTSDTLDINITSGKFTRPYYLFSGGERFLIDLALRISLSIILLRRKGCNNSTLLIDEGLGSLDGVNSTKVVELINLIQTKYGFQKVLLVTHVLNIQDMVQRKVEVEKKFTPDEHSEVTNV